MPNLQTFSNSEFGELGVIEFDGKEYFPATQCAKILGYTNPRKAIRDHCKGGNETLLPSAGGTQKVKIIPEGDLYRLIIRSKLPAAERFERWVFDEVLPSIRKSGGYGQPDIGAIIAQTVTATAAELMKQLIPAIAEAVSQAVAKLPAPTVIPVSVQACAQAQPDAYPTWEPHLFYQVADLPGSLRDTIDIEYLTMRKKCSVSLERLVRICRKHGYPVDRNSMDRYLSVTFRPV